MTVTLQSYLTTRKTNSVLTIWGCLFCTYAFVFIIQCVFNCHVCYLITSEIVPAYLHLDIMQCDFCVVCFVERYSLLTLIR
jgi:hypothetical protein